MSQQDVDEFQRTLQNRLNLSDEEAQEITNQIRQIVDDTRRTVQQTIETAQQKAIDAAEKTSSQISSIAFWTFIASLVGLIAAVAGGKFGEVKDVRI